MIWNETRGQDANTYVAEHESGARLFVFYWRDGYAESHFNFDDKQQWAGVYTRAMKVPLDKVKEDLLREVENYLK